MSEIIEHAAASAEGAALSDQHVYCPPAPKPQTRPLGPIGLLRTLRRNPLECFARPHFHRPIVTGGLPFGQVLLVHDPRAIRHVLLDNADNYRKDRLQRRVLSAGLNDGLLSAEGERWRSQRRVVAPMFARRTVMDFAPAMVRAAENLIDRWFDKPDGATIDVVAEMTHLTLDVLERSIFSDGLGRQAEDIRAAMTTYFNTIGKISPLDLVGAPDFIPRLGRLRVRATLRFFEAAINDVIATRRRLLAAQPARAPCDLLTHLLSALDTETGTRLTEAEVRSNILTFVAAGHETTANSLSWALFLLSQSPKWHDRVRAEADREMDGPIEGIAERLRETRAVVEETIRLYPPIAAISRVAVGGDGLNGVSVKPGSLIVISPYVLHRHRLLWDQPAAFDPRRFLGAARSRIDRFAYLPFGAGPRTCIGSGFALQEATIVLAMIAKYFTCELRPGHPVWPLLRVTLRPGNGLPMDIRRRPSATRANGSAESAITS
jgi:cytochrome P450